MSTTAERAASIETRNRATGEVIRSYVAFRPLGVLLAVMPWNLPYRQVFRAAARRAHGRQRAALKHAANVSGQGTSAGGRPAK